MDLPFANPAGLWALLGIPAVLAIHFLQRESRRVETSTLFLLARLGPESAQGRRVERLRQSLPLWLQLLAVLLLALLLARPQTLRPDSVQSVVVVLDASVSMEAFRTDLHATLTRRLTALSRAARRTEWTLLDSDPGERTLYRGGDLARLLEAVDSWRPRLGAHDPAPALATAQGVQGGRGVVVFVTDTPRDPPAGVELLAVGRPLDNVGFVGLTATADEWRALVANPGSTPQTRRWWMESDGRRSEPATLDLAPGEVRTLRGGFSADRLELVIDGDAFGVDDRLPMVRPRPKPLSLGVPAEPAFFGRLAASVPDARVEADAPVDVAFRVYDPFAPAPIPPRSVSVVHDPAPATTWVSGGIVAEDHPLTRDLAWSGLLCRDTMSVPAKAGDEVLVWAGERPLIFLRGEPGAEALVVNFDLAQSNADRLPAFVVLLHRYLERVRAAKVVGESANVETWQRLEVGGNPAGPPPVGEGTSADASRAPARPGFFRVRQGEAVLLDGAAHFADAREADFRAAGSADTLARRETELREVHRRSETFTPWLAAALLVVTLGSWAATAPSRRRQA